MMNKKFTTFASTDLTFALVDKHLSRDLVRIVLGYFVSRDRDIIVVARIGEYETCEENMKQNFCTEKWFYGGCFGGHKEIMDMVLSYGTVGDTVTAFIYACKGGNPHIARYLASQSPYGYEWGLEIACKLNAVDTINELIRAGARDFYQGLTVACYSNSKDAMRLMIAHGVKICGSCGLPSYAHV